MATVSELRAGLATNLGTIAGLRTTATVPDQVNPPIAVIMPPTITYDLAFARSGGDEYEFIVMVIVGRVDERSRTEPARRVLHRNRSRQRQGCNRKR
jgi:hypothetical protein